MEIIEYYDGTEKEEGKEYKLIKRVSNRDTLFLYYEEIKVDEEKIKLENKIKEMDGIIEDLMLTILDIIPVSERM